MKLTVVTIVKNDTQSFLRTSESLVQVTGEFEWLVVSPDTEISHLLSSLMDDNPKLKAKFIQDSGKGIYSAMQSAVDQIPNDHWVWFMNAGDYFYSKNVIEKLEPWLEISSLDWVSTRVRYLTKSGDFLFSYGTWRNKKSQLFARNFASHQGFICKSNAIKSVGGFDSKYKIAGDWDLICKVTQEFQGQSINLDTAVFHLGGASSQQRQLGNRELLDLRTLHLGRGWKLLSYMWFAVRFGRNSIILFLEMKSPSFVNTLRTWFWKIAKR